MSTTKQKEAAKKNIAKAREIQSERAHGIKIPRQTRGLSTAEQDKLPNSAFAFPKERKEPLVDAKHVRNAIARFDQVEGISDREKDAAWKRIMKAAKQCDVDVHESSWRELGHAGKSSSAKKTTTTTKATTTSKPTSTRKTTTVSKSTTTSRPSAAKKSVAAKKATSAKRPVAAKK